MKHLLKHLKEHKAVYLVLLFLLVAIIFGAYSTQNAYAAGEKITMTSSANIRAEPGQNNKFLGRASKGQSFELLEQGKAPNGKVWYKANYNGKVGWTCSSYSKLSPQSSGDKKLTITGEPTNVRAGAGYNFNKIGKAHNGNVFTLYASCKDNKGNTWYKINFNGKDGWVLGSLAQIGEKKATKPTASSNSTHGKLIGTFTATAYCGTEGGGENRRTATGYSLVGKSRTDAMTVAVDKKVIPLNTKLYIEFPAPYSHFNGCYTARDTGGAIKGNKIDLYFGWSNIKDANKFGVRKGVKIYYA